MCLISKIKTAQSVLKAVGNNPELLKKVSAEYNNQNFTMALDMVNILLKAAAVSILTPEFLYAELYAGECKIEFTKADGTTRKARATLNVECGYVPADGVELKPVDQIKRDKKSHLLTFYDLDKKAIRCCKIDTITEFTRVLSWVD